MAAVELHDLPSAGQSNTRTRKNTGYVPTPVEAIEDVGQVLRRNPQTSVGYGHQGPVPFTRSIFR